MLNPACRTSAKEHLLNDFLSRPSRAALPPIAAEGGCAPQRRRSTEKTGEGAGATRASNSAAEAQGGTMDYKGEYRIDEMGLVHWHQGLAIVDEGIKAAYRQSTLIEFLIEDSAIMGVKVGMA